MLSRKHRREAVTQSTQEGCHMRWGIIMAAVSMFGMLLLLIATVNGEDPTPVSSERLGEPEEEFKEAA